MERRRGRSGDEECEEGKEENYFWILRASKVSTEFWGCSRLWEGKDRRPKGKKSSVAL